MYGTYSLSETSISDLYQAPNIGFVQTTPIPYPILNYTNTYSDLLTSEFQLPNMKAFVTLLTDGFNTNRYLLKSLINLFDIDTAIGDQLDILGQWIGISRNISPAINNIFFSWDSPGLGWDLGFWQDIYSQNGISILPDPQYRNLLKARIALNNWTGNIPDIISALTTAFPNLQFFIQDNQDMTMNLLVVGNIDPLTQVLIKNGYFDIRPSGVQLTFETSSIFFAWDLENTYFQGFDLGNWPTVLT